MRLAEMSPDQVAQWKIDQSSLQAHSTEQAAKARRKAKRETAIDRVIEKFPDLDV